MAAHFPCLLHNLQGHYISRVACGSAHTVAWTLSCTESGRKVKRKTKTVLPTQIPLEYNFLRSFSVETLRNRLVLLHQFSDLFMDVVPLHLRSSTPSLNQLRPLLVSSGKECVFRKRVQATMKRDKQHGPVIEINRIQTKQQRETGSIPSEVVKTVFEQVFEKMDSLLPNMVLLPQRVWKVKFSGESVDDCGGGYSESIAEMCDELQEGVLSLLIPTPNNRDEAGASRDCMVFNPQFNNTHMFKFLGILIGIAVRSGNPLSLNLAGAMWKLLVGLELDLDDISEMDKHFVPKFLYIRQLSDHDLDAMQLPFLMTSVTGEEVGESRHQVVDSSNKSQFIQQSIKHRLHEFDHVVSAVRSGMECVLPLPLLSLFTGKEFETMVCGSPDFSIALSLIHI